MAIVAVFFLIGLFAVICQCIGGAVEVFKTIFPYAFGIGLVIVICLCIFC